MESLQRTVLTLANSREAEREVGGQASHCYLASTKSRSSKTDKIVIFTFHINVTSEEEGKKNHNQGKNIFYQFFLLLMSRTFNLYDYPRPS